MDIKKYHLDFGETPYKKITDLDLQKGNPVLLINKTINENNFYKELFSMFNFCDYKNSSSSNPLIRLEIGARKPEINRRSKDPIVLTNKIINYYPENFSISASNIEIIPAYHDHFRKRRKVNSEIPYRYNIDDIYVGEKIIGEKLKTLDPRIFNKKDIPKLFKQLRPPRNILHRIFRR